MVREKIEIGDLVHLPDMWDSFGIVSGVAYYGYYYRNLVIHWFRYDERKNLKNCKHWDNTLEKVKEK